MTETAAEMNTASPWYHHGWVWAVFSIPFTAVLFGIVMLVSAGYRPDDLVKDDYYKAGMAINQDLAFDRRAVELGAKARLTALTPEGAIFHIEAASDAVTLSLYHVTDSGRDISLPLTREGDTIFTLRSSAFSDHLSATGVWYIEIRDEGHGWRLRSRLVTPMQQLELAAR